MRKADYDRALSLQANGQNSAALDVLWELRLKVDLSIYRRALVNVTLAAYLRTKGREKYAQECLDLLDLFRQQHADHVNIEEELEHISDLEELAKEIIDGCSSTNTAVASDPTQIRLDPTTGLFSDTSERSASPTKGVAGGLQSLSLARSSSLTNISTSSESEPEVVWESTPTPLEDIPTNLPYIEGFLRDSYYTPFNSGQFSSSTTTTTAAAIPTSVSTPIPQVYRDLTPASSSPTQQSRHQE